MLIADASGWEETISATSAAGIPSAVSAIFTTGKVSATAAEIRATHAMNRANTFSSILPPFKCLRDASTAKY